MKLEMKPLKWPNRITCYRALKQVLFPNYCLWALAITEILDHEIHGFKVCVELSIYSFFKDTYNSVIKTETKFMARSQEVILEPLGIMFYLVFI